MPLKGAANDLSSEAREQQLNSKDLSLYRSLQELLEYKQYKKGLKICEQILRSNPNHGETLCTKGLFEYHLAISPSIPLSEVSSAKEAAFQTIKSGIKANIKSATCWNIYGFVNKSEFNFSEALSCYKTAYRLDGDNLVILRDLAFLQSQLGHWQALIQTRQAMIRLKPTNRSFWIALAVAFYLNGQRKDSLQVLDQFDASMEGEFELQQMQENFAIRFEVGQISLFKMRVLFELELWEQALNYVEQMILSEKKKRIFCLEKIKEAKAIALLRLAKFHEAKKEFFELLQEFNSQSKDYVKGWLDCCVGLGKTEAEAKSNRIQGIKILCDSFPKSLAVKKQLFIYSSVKDEDFLKEFHSFCSKSIPSLWLQWKAILANVDCEDSEKKLQLLIDRFSNFQSWNAHYFLSAFHLSQKNFNEAFSHCESSLNAASNESEEIDSWLLKAKIHKVQGQFAEAAQFLRECALRDPRDRYLNSKCVKYFLLAGQPEEALEMLKVYLKDKSLDNLKDYLEMQPLWLTFALMNCYRRLERLADCLNYAVKGCKMLLEFRNDIFDFHGYCLRKMTLCNYVDLVADNLTLGAASEGKRNGKYFIPIVKCAMEVYLEMGKSLEGKMQLTSLNDEGSSSYLKVIKGVLSLFSPKIWEENSLSGLIEEFNKFKI